MIKIIKVERIQDGVERFIFSAGIVSLERFRELENTIDSISEKTQTPREKVAQSRKEVVLGILVLLMISLTVYVMGYVKKPNPVGFYEVWKAVLQRLLARLS